MDRYVFKNCDLIELNYSLEADTYILYENIEVECVKFDKKYNDIEIFISIDNENYERLDFKNNIYLDYEDNFVVRVGKNIKSLKINPFDKVLGIYKKKYKGLILSTRSDLFGSRMLPILNSMYVAEKTGFKFGFTWDVLDRLKDNGGIVERKDLIFDSNFIDDFVYDNEYLFRFPAESSINFNSIYSIENSKYDDYWGWYNSHGIVLSGNVIRDLDEKDYFDLLPKLWDKIGFSVNYLKLKVLANNTCMNFFKNDFISIHLRSGDIVYYEYFRRIALHPLMARKYVPYEIIIELIKDKIANYSIVLFSDNNDLAFKIKEYFCNGLSENKLFILDDLYCKDNYSYMEQTFFEVQLMSYSNEIYAHPGGFNILASLIGKDVNLIPFDQCIELNVQADIILKNKSLLSIDNIQKATSYAHLFYIYLQLNSSSDKLIECLNIAVNFDNNLIYNVVLFDLYLKHNNIHEASNIVRTIIDNDNIKDFLDLYEESSSWDYKSYNEVKSDYKITFDFICGIVCSDIYLNYCKALVYLRKNNILEAYDCCKKSLNLKQAKRLFIRLFRKRYTYIFQKLFRKNND